MLRDVSCSALTFTPCQLTSLDLVIVHIWYIKGCVMHIYSPRSNNSLQNMEMHGNFQPHFQQKWVVTEYNSCGLEYYFVHILDQLQRTYIGHLDLLLFIIYRVIPEESFKTIAKPMHQNIV